MKTTFISTYSLSEASRLSISKLQAKLAESQKEVTTGRYADVGVALGHNTSDTVSLRQEYTRLKTITETNSIVETRLDVSQASIDGLVETVQKFIGQLIAARNQETGPDVVEGEAKANLIALADAMNVSVNDGYVFAGINADVNPMTNYFAEGATPANRQATADAFFARFGFAQNDPAAANISPSDMQSFLDNEFSDLFADPDWRTNWSSASDQNIKSRISSSELIETSTNVNEEAFRKLAKAYTMVADLGVQTLGEGTYQTIVDEATRLAGEAVQDMAKLQSGLGTAQQRVTDANNRMSIQIDIMSTHIGVLEGVDPYEAQTKVSALLQQIDTAYALTARIQSLSLLNYL